MWRDARFALRTLVKTPASSTIAVLAIALGIRLAIGSIGAYFLMKLFSGALHGVSAHDPLSFAAVGIFLLLVGSVASSIPARAATRLNPGSSPL